MTNNKKGMNLNEITTLKNKERNSSIELLRILSIFLIIMMHVGSLICYTNASMMNKIWLGAINAIGNCGVSCFILISGYYGVRFSKKNLYI